MKKVYKFLVKMYGEQFTVEIKSAEHEGAAWYLIEKQFDDADQIKLIK